MRPCLSMLLILLCMLAHAQKETSHWFLSGSRVTIDPTGISNAALAAMPVSFSPQITSTSVSDADGNLLFACDGKTIIDKNFSVMPALANANLQGYYKVLAVNIPHSTRYLVFYLQPNSYYEVWTYDRENAWTLKYAVVDLSLNGGLGDVTAYNKVVDTALSQGFTLVQGTSANDLWLVTHRKATHNFYCYKITSAGLSTVPVISTAGMLSNAGEYIFKDLKTSNNGKLIAGIARKIHSGLFESPTSFVEVFHFDASTGGMTNKVRSKRTIFPDGSYETVEFSPDDRLLYAGVMGRMSGLQMCGGGYAVGDVVQYNLCYTDSTEFTRYSMNVIHHPMACFPTLSWGRIQLGADKRIYMPYSGTTISCIDNPNRIGSYSNYVFNAHQVLAGNNATVVTPSFHHKVLEKAVKNNIVYSGGCYPAPLTFSVTNDTIGTISWDFGDPGSSSNTVTAATAGHVFSKPGFYTVTAQLYSSSGALIETLSELVEIKNPQQRLLHDYPADTSICSGGKLKVRLGVVNGIFHWAVKTTLLDDLYDLGTVDSLEISSSGTFYVEMRQNDCDGCVLRDSIRVTVLPVPYVNLDYDRNLCTGDSLQLKVNDQGASWIWSTGDTATSIWVRGGGIFWIQGEFNNNGCPKRDSIVIASIPGVNFALPGDTTLCSNQTLLLSPGVPNASYLWQNNTTPTTFNVTGPGTYWVRVTATNGCRRTDSITVNYVSAQQVFLGNDTTLCAGDSLVLAPAVVNARYLWSTGATTPSLTVRQTGSYWVQVNNGACTVTDTIRITFNSPPAVWLGTDTTLCDGQRVVLHCGINGGTWLWSNGSVEDTVVVTRPGAWWLRIYKGGCVVSDTVQISYKPLPAVNLGADTTLCTGQALTLSAGSPSVQSWQWQDGSTGSSYTVRAAGTYRVKVQGVNGCAATDSIAVRYNPLPSFSLGADTSLCEGESLRYTFNLTAAAFVWSTGNRSNSYTVTGPGLYWLEVAQGGCSRRDSISVQYKPMPVVQLGRDTTLCEGAQLSLSAYNSGALYTWSTGSGAPSITVGKPGAYAVAVNLDGCTRNDTVQVRYELLPRFSLGRDTALCKGQSFVLDPRIGNGALLWSDGTTAPSLTVKDPGLYSLQVTTRCGTASDDITVVNGICQLYMPNAFTPNKDGKNDLFRVKYPQFIKTFVMVIYNRWGQPVFSTRNAWEGWNGRFRNLDQPVGNYVWTITLTDLDGATASYTGTVLLLR